VKGEEELHLNINSHACEIKIDQMEIEERYFYGGQVFALAYCGTADFRKSAGNLFDFNLDL